MDVRMASEVSQHMQVRPPFDAPELRVEFIDKLNTIKGVSLPEDSLNRTPGFPRRALASGTPSTSFFAAMDWFLDATRAYESQS
jgi:hypothetical protein